MLVQRANMFLCRNSFKTIQDVVERLVPQCSTCFCKMKYFCVDESCLHAQPVCLNCSRSRTHKHFLHNLNRVELLHLDKEYLPRQVDAFKKKHEEVKELVESNRNAYLEVIEEYTHYVGELQEYMSGLEESLQRSIKSTEVFVQLDTILEDILTQTSNLTGNVRKEYWKLLQSMKLEQVKYDLLPDKYTVLSISRIRKEIEAIIEKYTSLTFQDIIKKEHMNAIFDYNDINKNFITNVFGNLEDRILRTCDQPVDPQVVKNLSKLIIQQIGFFDQQDLPHSIKEIEYENFDCSQHTRFPQKLQSLTLTIKFNSYLTFKFSSYSLKDLRRLQIRKENYCINTSIDYQHLKMFRNLESLDIFDEGVTEDTRQFLYELAVRNKMRVVRIRPDNLHSLEINYLKHKKALVLSQMFSRSKAQYLRQSMKERLFEYVIKI